MTQQAGLTRPDPQTPIERGVTAPFLYVFEGGIKGTLHSLVPPKVQLGRAPGIALRFSHPTVSRVHAQFDIDQDGFVYVCDLGSSAGTFVNGKRLVPKKPKLLQINDRLQFGTKVVLKFLELDEREEQLYREQFRRAVCDSLTGLFNRPYFLNQLGAFPERYSTLAQGVGMIMMDVDRFKQINDTHGHRVGDSVLTEVANVLRKAMRADDLVSRFGGEEFIIAAPLDSLEQATTVAERIRQGFDKGKLMALGREVRVTLSFGVAYASFETKINYDLLIKSADLCLIQAKRGGRNKVVTVNECPEAQLDFSKLDVKSSITTRKP